VSAAVEKIEEQREAPDDFFGHRKRVTYSTTCHFSAASLRKSCHPDCAAQPRRFGHRKRVMFASAAHIRHQHVFVFSFHYPSDFLAMKWQENHLP